MSEVLEIDLRRMLQRRGSKSQLDDISLEDGELGFTTDEKGLYIGDNGDKVKILTQTSIADDLNTAVNDMALSARQGAELRGRIEQMDDYYKGFLSGLDGDFKTKQDLLVHEGDNSPNDIKKIWYDTN